MEYLPESEHSVNYKSANELVLKFASLIHGKVQNDMNYKFSGAAKNTSSP